MHIDDLDIRTASSFLQRLAGLLGRCGLAPHEALWLVPCSNIHTAFMRFTIDAVFLDREGVVVAVVPGLRPWRAAAALRAHSCLELAAGTAQRLGLHAGMRVSRLAARARRAGAA
jgi:uncharacterized membrane protein (UPF0127 family)